MSGASHECFNWRCRYHDSVRTHTRVFDDEHSPALRETGKFRVLLYFAGCTHAFNGAFICTVTKETHQKQITINETFM